jgi:hypothetical protein
MNHNTNRPLELDILLPDEKKALEFNGYHWHSDQKIIIRDQIKIEQCKKLGIKLITICEHDWKYSRERCEERIRKFILS